MCSTSKEEKKLCLMVEITNYIDIDLEHQYSVSKKYLILPSQELFYLL